MLFFQILFMISKIVLENWKSHKNSELEFGKGTNVLVGIMGAGKTAVMDAICFAFFGTFPSLNSKKVSLSELILSKPNSMEKARIELHFSQGKKFYKLERTIFAEKSSQAKLFEEGKLIAGPKPSDVSKEVEKVLGMDFELFSRAVYSEQNQIDFFLKLSPKDRKSKFDELLSLDKYETVRQNSVKASNSLKQKASEKKSLLKELGTGKEKELQELQKKIAEKEAENVKLEKAFLEQKNRVEELEKELKDLEKKEEMFQKKSEEVVKLKTRAEGARKTVEEAEKSLKKPMSEISEEEIFAEKKELEKKVSEFKALSKEVEALKLEKNSFQEKEKILKEEISKKPSKSKKEIEKIVSELEHSIEKFREKFSGLKDSLNEVLEKQAVYSSKISEVEKASLSLEDAEASCPVCRKPLDERHKKKLLEDHSKELKKFKEIVEKFGKEKKEFEKEAQILEKELKELEDEKRKNSDVLEKFSSFEEKETVLLEVGKKISALEKILSEKLKGIGEEKEKKLNELLLKNSRIEEAFKKFKDLGVLEKDLKEKENDLKEISFNPEDLKKKRDSLFEQRTSANSLSNLITSNNSLLKEHGSYFDSLKESVQKFEEMKKEAENLMFFSEKLSIFTNVLKDTQSQLRVELVETINHAMDNIWNKIYPYKDFSTARLEIKEGDYEFFVRNRSNEWTRVEGILSGGERSAAALTIRIAFSLVLSQNLSMLILDEPTHNLDSNSVQVLSSVLKDHLPELVEQVFVITHDKQLEKAASSFLYLLKRDKDSDAVSVPVVL